MLAEKYWMWDLSDFCDTYAKHVGNYVLTCHLTSLKVKFEYLLSNESVGTYTVLSRGKCIKRISYSLNRFSSRVSACAYVFQSCPIITNSSRWTLRMRPWRVANSFYSVSRNRKILALPGVQHCSENPCTFRYFLFALDVMYHHEYHAQLHNSVEAMCPIVIKNFPFVSLLWSNSLSRYPRSPHLIL